MGFKVYVTTNNSDAIDKFDGREVLQFNGEPTNVIDRKEMNLYTCAKELKKKLHDDPGKYVIKGDIMPMSGTRADTLDLWNLINDGAAGVILETDDVFVMELCADIYDRWVEEKGKKWGNELHHYVSVFILTFAHS